MMRKGLKVNRFHVSCINRGPLTNRKGTGIFRVELLTMDERKRTSGSGRLLVAGGWEMEWHFETHFVKGSYPIMLAHPSPLVDRARDSKMITHI
jgi:hypothetical protein